MIKQMSFKIPFLLKFLAFRDHLRVAHTALAEIALTPWRPIVIFDVGANNGSSFSWLSGKLPWIQIYAFEPTPNLVKTLHSQFDHLSNYHIIPKAVGEMPGWAKFNVAGQGDWGCSSLLTFSDNLDKTWPGRTDFRVTSQIDVEVIRLDNFVRQERIFAIDFLHIDTQGTDISVLRSLGDEISRVRSGVIEVPQNREVMLYKNQHTREEAVEFLDKNGFMIWKTVSQQNEDNLYFRKIN